MIATIDSVLLVRHGRSLANDDPSLYLRLPDHVITLSRPEDDPSALQAGAHLASLGLEPRQVAAWTSTYVRCRQTQSLVLHRAFGAEVKQVRCHESFLLREQEFGDWDGLTEAEMAERDHVRFARRQLLSDHLGRFYFRYPNGESRADVAQRVGGFISKIQRSRRRHHVVFLHGVTQRAFRMAWLNRPVEWFEAEPNPSNASLLQIHRGPEGGWVERYLGGGP